MAETLAAKRQASVNGSTEALASHSSSSLRLAMVSHDRDWSLNPKDAWIFGIVVGWEEALDEVCDLHGWDESTRARLAALHQDFCALVVNWVFAPRVAE